MTTRAAKNRLERLKSERKAGENFWRVSNCVAQHLCWGREKVGQKARREGEEGRAESGGKTRKSDPAANSPGVAVQLKPAIFAAFCHLLAFFTVQVILGGPRL